MGTVRESKAPQSTPTFCFREPNGWWRIVHAYNKLDAAAIPAQTPIPRKCVLQNNMAGCTMYSALELVDGYYQLLCELVISRLQRLVTKWYALEFAGYAPETFKCPGHIQSSGDTSVSPSLSSCTNIL